MAWYGHLCIYARYMVWRLEVPEAEALIVDPMVVQTRICALEDYLQGPASNEAFQEKDKAVQKCCCKAEDKVRKLEDKVKQLVLAPVWSKPGHWALLSFDLEAKELRYYDTLQTPAPGNLLCARM